jgi:adenosylmethionine-8-amino-7-oxononanoate aminotransferase
MFDRFTDRARKVMGLARQETLRFHHDHIGPEHVLIGLLSEGGGIGASVLKSLDVDLEKLRREAERRIKAGAAQGGMGQVPFSAPTKRVLEGTLDEATKLGHNYIGTEHLLLGLLRVREGIAAEALASRGVTLEAVREGVRSLLGEGPPETAVIATEAPSTDGPDLLARDARHVWHPFTQAQTSDPPLPIASARGSWLTLSDGRRVFDGISSWWTNLHGHGHPRIARSISRQAEVLDHVQFAGATHAPAVDVAERLVALAPKGLTRVFFSDDGSTAVEVAVKMALQAQAQRGFPRRTGYVAFERAYHGDTVGALSVGDPRVFASPFGPLTFATARAPVPRDAARRAGKSQEEEVARCLKALGSVLARDREGIAAVILEPMVQAAGGMAIHPAAFLKGVADLARAHGALFIADEVMTGFFRTGTCFAVEHAGVVPDLLCVAKGLTGGALPLAATLSTEEVFDAFRGPDLARAFLHGHSYTANPIACAAAAASLALLEAENAAERVAALAGVHARRLTELASKRGVRTVRHLGSLGVLELDADPTYMAQGARTLAARMLQRGVLVRPLGPVVYLLPPYSTTPAELDAAYDALAASLER